jgi:hypothetical protein
MCATISPTVDLIIPRMIAHHHTSRRKADPEDCRGKQTTLPFDVKFSEANHIDKHSNKQWS